MRQLVKYAVVLLVVLAPSLQSFAAGVPGTETVHFTVTRNGEPIGTNTVQVRRNGNETVIETTTHIAVKIAFVTVYRFDQNATERWVDGRFSSMQSVTDDNGTMHNVTARRQGNSIALEADGKRSEIDHTMIPASPWNPSIVEKAAAFNPQDGKVMRLAVVDRGEERLVLQGQEKAARHYSITSTFPQEVWYDHRKQLVKVQLRAPDGSIVAYLAS